MVLRAAFASGYGSYFSRTFDLPKHGGNCLLHTNTNEDEPFRRKLGNCGGAQTIGNPPQGRLAWAEVYGGLAESCEPVAAGARVSAERTFEIAKTSMAGAVSVQRWPSVRRDCNVKIDALVTRIEGRLCLFSPNIHNLGRGASRRISACLVHCRMYSQPVFGLPRLYRRPSSLELLMLTARLRCLAHHGAVALGIDGLWYCPRRSSFVINSTFLCRSCILQNGAVVGIPR